MKLSFWTLGMPPWSNAEFAEHAAELGYGGIDLRCTKGGNIAVDSSEAEIDEVMRTYAEKGIAIASLLGYQERGNGKDPVDWDKVEADLISHAKLSRRMSNVPVRITVGYTDPSTTWETYLTNLAKATKTAISEVPDVMFMFQNHAGSATATQLGEMTEKAADPRFRFGFSPDHCYVEGEDPVALAERFASLISQLHIADRKRTPEGGYEACWIGEGIVPHAQILEILAKHGFDGWVSLKWERGGGSKLPLGDELLPHYVKYMNSLGVSAPAR
jgi:sugar phosphate isomerase/epimerase